MAVIFSILKCLFLRRHNRPYSTRVTDQEYRDGVGRSLKEGGGGGAGSVPSESATGTDLRRYSVIREKDKLKTNAVCFHSTHFKDLCGPHYFSIRTSPIFILGSQLPAIFIFFGNCLPRLGALKYIYTVGCLSCI